MEPYTIPILIEENLNGLYTLAAESGKYPHGVEEGFSWVNVSPNIWPNYIYNAHFNEADAQSRIQAVTILIDKGFAPPFWITGPKLTIADFSEMLLKCNFRNIMKWPGMAIDLKNKSMITSNRNIEVKEVQSTLQLEEWVNITQRILFNQKSLDTELLMIMLNSNQVTLLLGYLDGKAVATLMVYINKGIAGFFMVTTLPEFRKMGISGTMLLRAMEIAKEKNCYYAVLQANSMSYMMYKSIGFQEYCTFDIYWKMGNR